MKRVIFLIVLALFVFSACEKDPVENTSVYGLDYYPLQLGKFVIYEVDSTVYTQLPKDTVFYKYQIKEKISDTYTDNQGNTAYRLERYIKNFNPSKPYDSIPWRMKEVWMLNANNISIQLVEANVRYTKLVFPVIQGATWNGNANNSLAAKNYYYEFIDEPRQINGNNLTAVLKVAQNTYTTLISSDIESEQYAKGIGLIYRQIEHLESGTLIPNVPVKNRIESGVIYTQTLKSYGYE